MAEENKSIDNGSKNQMESVRDAIRKAYAAGYAKAAKERGDNMTRSEARESGHVQECAHYYIEGEPLPEIGIRPNQTK